MAVRGTEGDVEIAVAIVILDRRLVAAEAGLFEIELPVVEQAELGQSDALGDLFHQRRPAATHDLEVDRRARQRLTVLFEPFLVVEGDGGVVLGHHLDGSALRVATRPDEGQTRREPSLGTVDLQHAKLAVLERADARPRAEQLVDESAGVDVAGADARRVDAVVGQDAHAALGALVRRRHSPFEVVVEEREQPVPVTGGKRLDERFADVLLGEEGDVLEIPDGLLLVRVELDVLTRGRCRELRRLRGRRGGPGRYAEPPGTEGGERDQSCSAEGQPLHPGLQV